MNILVTGASGFVGKHICDYLNTKSHNVIKLVRSNGNNRLNEFELDLSNETAVEIFLESKAINKKIDVIIHLAAVFVENQQNEAEQIQVLVKNIEIAKNTVTLVKTLMPHKLINFSSMAVYPNTDGIFAEDSQILMSGNTDCMYGLSKFCSENIFDYMLRKHSVIRTHLRISQVYGYGMRDDRIMPVMAKELEKKNSITLFGEGERISNFISITKLLAITECVIINDFEGILNVGDENLSYLQLAEMVVREKGYSSPLIIKKMEGSRAKFILNTSKLQKIMINCREEEK